MIELSTYSLRVLRNDKELSLYRGSREHDDSQILVLSPAMEYPAPETLKRLEHEYSLREELDPAWAARPIAITHYRDRTVLVLQDPGGVLLDQSLDRPLDVGFSLRVAISLSSAIDQLHQRGIIHKDIKPANVLANSVTGRCWLMGFGIASRLPRERQTPEPPELVAGTLAYMAPEQTGRMNRSIDSRSDLYSLGVTLYEVLTGTLPFTASDPMEWVHCHIAREPLSPSQRFKNVPVSVSAVIMKLLAKTAEERYQTAVGAKIDFQRCLAEWENHGRVDEFALGEYDIPDRLLIPEKLYGRAREIDTLLTSFDRVVASGHPELVLVSGYSGIGKSSVVNELHKGLVPPRGLFASGKFDQYKREIPYSTLAQAFQGLIRSLLGKSDAELSQWRDALRQALDPNGQLILDLVPELALILGEQPPPVPELAPQDAQRRFQLVFRRFISVFARPEHPLALFLDDLQWLDAATLDLLEDLLRQPDVRHLMLIGAYRDNEVNSSHPLIRKLEEIRQAGAIVHEMVLAPLSCKDLGRLVADSLHCQPIRAAPLSQLVHQRTAGNPFFAIQFITALAEEELLRFDHAGGNWVWDVSGIGSKGYTDNVVDLMLGKLNRLPVETRKALKAFACLGNSAEITTLSIVHGTSKEKLHSDLWEALRAGLVLKEANTYKFLHDRIQQAAYTLIPEEQLADVHLRISRLLLASMTPDELAEHLFSVANQFNRSAARLEDRDEKAKVATLNLRAGRKAKAAAAYASACRYLEAGRALLDERAWDSQYGLMFALRLEEAECELLSGNFQKAERLIEELLQRATSNVDQAAAYHLKVLLHTVKSQNVKAVDSALTALHLLGIDVPARPSQEQVQAEYETVWRNLDGRPIESLIELPLMTDRVPHSAMQVLSSLLGPAYFTDMDLFTLLACRMVNLSKQHGVSGASAHGLAYLGGILGPVFHRYAQGHRFAKLACDLVDQHGFIAYQAKVYHAMAVVAVWTQPIATVIDFNQAAFRAATETGDLTSACYSMARSVTLLLLRGDPLDAAWQDSERSLEFALKAGYRDTADRILSQQRFIAAMQGRTATLSSLSGAQFDESTFEAQLTANRTALMVCFYWIIKLQSGFLAGEYGEALTAAGKAKELLWSAVAQIQRLDYFYYAALTMTALYENATPAMQAAWRSLLAAHREQLREWANIYPPTFADKHALVSAEIARIEGRNLEAMGLYDEAIHAARENGFVQNEGIASELAARFYAGRGFEDFAHLYLRKARYCYLRWGADGKVRQLDELYPHLREEELVPGPTNTIGASVERLDLATVIKVSQTVSGEIVLEKLIDTLMRTAIEHAGAERGLLILRRDVEQSIEAEVSTSGDTVIVSLREAPVRSASGPGDAGRFSAEAEVPESIIHYVVRTQELVILEDAGTQNPFSADPYLRRHHARSILCLPLINQAKLIGVLYLENNLTPHVFTPTRIAVLKLLASQAAISLENTRLYRGLEAREAKIQSLVDANIIGIHIWNLEGEIIEANEAFLRMLGHSRADLISGGMTWAELTPAEWSERDQRAKEEVMTTGVFQPFEKEYFRKDGGRVPVLIGGAVFKGGGNEGVSFVLDLSEQKRAEEALQTAQTDLAHASRVVTMGELTASIAHEISQPISSIITNANVGLRWLERDVPDLEETAQAIRRIGRDGERASAVLSRMRALFKKTQTPKEPLDINEVIQEVLTITQHELQRHRVLVRTQFAHDLPLVTADRIQMQQVILNLVVNAIQAMSAVLDGPRELQLTSQMIAGIEGESAEESDPRTDSPGPMPSQILVAIKDSGPGVDPECLDHLFDPFFSTKTHGLGIGLSISRSIIEAHSGRLWAKANAPRGAIFQFTLPI